MSPRRLHPKGDQFYCTLSSQGKHYLVKGDIATQTATVLRENVECPSLSPNGTRIAYKNVCNPGIDHLAASRSAPCERTRHVPRPAAKCR